jgi:peptidoglycan-associated lipoprotein
MMLKSGKLAAVLFVLLVLGSCGKRPPPLPPSQAPTSSPGTLEPSDADRGATVLVPELELRIEPPIINPGESALLTWESQNATRVTIEPSIGAVEASGRVKFYPDSTTTYSVTAEGPGGEVTKRVTVEVRVEAPGAGTVTEEDLRGLSQEEQFQVEVKPVFFSFDSTELTDESQLTLDADVRWLNRTENRLIRFVLEGHADERGSEEYNLALGDKRATVVRDYLVQRGVDAARINTVSLGEERPFDTSQTEAAYALNRRTEFVLLKEP